MAKVKTVRIFMMILAATATMAACAKKDSEFKGRKNSAGAGFVGDLNKNQRANTTSQTLNIVAPTIEGVQAPVANQQGGISITSRIGIGNRLFDLTMSHSQVNQMVSANQMVGDVQVVAEAMCVNVDCSPYFLNIMTMRGGQRIKQIVIKKFFVWQAGEETANDYVIERDGAEFETFTSAIQILNQAIPEPAQ